MGNAVEMQPLPMLLAGVVVIASVGLPLTPEGGGRVGDTRVNRCTLAGGVDCGFGSSFKRIWDEEGFLKKNQISC